MANAFARRARSGKALFISERLVGARRAANTPCPALAAISVPRSPANPPARLARPKPSNPIRNALRIPRNWEMRPPISSSDPNARVYAVITHCRPESANARSACASGRATAMIVVSNTTVTCARQAHSTRIPVPRPDFGSIDALPVCWPL